MTYLKNLKNEELDQNIRLEALKDENTFMQNAIEDMKEQTMDVNSEINHLKKEYECMVLDLSSKEMEKKKWEKDRQEKQKLLSSEKQKTRDICDELNRLNN